MDNQEISELQAIIDNAPDGSVCVDGGLDYFNADGVMWSTYCKQFDFHDRPEIPYRMLGDIRTILEQAKRIEDQAEKIKTLTLDFGLSKLSAKQKMDLLDSCEAALNARDEKIESLEKQLKALKGGE